jgi:dimethylhistidine N-methyltransferase
MITLLQDPFAKTTTSAQGQFLADVVRGLRSWPKQLPCKYFYDRIGSELFERITQLDEYYLTRTEYRIMRDHITEMAELLGPRCLLVEYGSGSSMKTRMLLDNLYDPAGYIPIDVSSELLQESVKSLTEDYPFIDIMPLTADFTGPLRLPLSPDKPERVVVYFPGSTIGNLTPKEASKLLRKTAQLCGPNGGMLLGVDMQKDIRVLESAYNDRKGVSAAFNRNILARINCELDGTFNLDHFVHSARYNIEEGRMEMHLVSRCRQWVRIGDSYFLFAPGETIHTENSYKFNFNQLQKMAALGGMDIHKIWTDPRRYFSVMYLTIQSNEED